MTVSGDSKSYGIVSLEDDGTWLFECIISEGSPCDVPVSELFAANDPAGSTLDFFDVNTGIGGTIELTDPVTTTTTTT